MFGSKKKAKFSIQGKLLIKLLKENQDWTVVIAGDGTKQLHSPKANIHLYPKYNNESKRQLLMSFDKGSWVNDAFSELENCILHDEVLTMINQIKDNKIIQKLQDAIKSISSNC
jgi:hypothetical protein